MARGRTWKVPYRVPVRAATSRQQATRYGTCVKQGRRDNPHSKSSCCMQRKTCAGSKRRATVAHHVVHVAAAPAGVAVRVVGVVAGARVGDGHHHAAAAVAGAAAVQVVAVAVGEGGGVALHLVAAPAGRTAKDRWWVRKANGARVFQLRACMCGSAIACSESQAGRSKRHGVHEASTCSLYGISAGGNTAQVLAMDTRADPDKSAPPRPVGDLAHDPDGCPLAGQPGPTHPTLCPLPCPCQGPRAIPSRTHPDLTAAAAATPPPPSPGPQPSTNTPTRTHPQLPANSGSESLSAAMLTPVDTMWLGRGPYMQLPWSMVAPLRGGLARSGWWWVSEARVGD